MDAGAVLKKSQFLGGADRKTVEQLLRDVAADSDPADETPVRRRATCVGSCVGRLGEVEVASRRG
jgi:hypothetical protein